MNSGEEAQRRPTWIDEHCSPGPFSAANQDIKSRVTYSMIIKRLNSDAVRDFILRELDRVGLGHNTFTPPAIELIIRSADGDLRRVKNLCLGCSDESIR